MRTVVVYVHGLWLSGGEAVWLRRRLAEYLHADARAFSYPSVAADATTNARALAKFLTAITADTLHLVGHSLGGLVILRLFEDDPGAHLRMPPGRIVLLGSPLRGSRAALNLARLPFGRKIMGSSAAEELLAPRGRRWNGMRELGIIGGNLGMGLGRLVGSLGGPSDGTILVEETQLDGAADRVVLRVSHSGMLFSAVVAQQAGCFLQTGRFSRQAGASLGRRGPAL
jgi:pimeloyl-ACP methyl ester carboxylesterase